ncbi:MAG: DUF6941 family protein [Sulfobacillus sp.]
MSDEDRPIQAILMLADSAQVVDGKLFVLGGGWTLTGPRPSPMALVAQLQVPRCESDTKHVVRFELLTDDGGPYLVPTGPTSEAAQAPMVIETEVAVAGSSDLRAGALVSIPVAINLSPLQLSPGQRYSWRLSIDGRTNPGWQAQFDVRPQSA